MEEKKRIKLFESHKILLEEKDRRINEANQGLRLRMDEFRDAVVVVTKELGVPKEDIEKWRVSEDGQALEKIEVGDQGSQGDK